MIQIAPDGQGYFRGIVDRVPAGSRCRYRLNGGREFPDPASRSQPEGVHGPSELIADHFEWQDASWQGIPLRDYILYELHIGTFTAEGTFDAAISHLDYLADLGVTAVEIMPVAQFPGGRNWGYDGVYPLAVQSTYGGAAGLKRLVNAAHARCLAAVLDVVYNHLGPEGNYFGQFGDYFTDRYQTPWGPAINFGGDSSSQVRRFFIENAVRWVTEFHIDALRLDAVHAIFDSSPTHILHEIADSVHDAGSRLGRQIFVIAESDLNDVRLVSNAAEGGYGLDVQWSDDFHHALHAVLTGERSSYYQDFGSVRDLAKAFTEGFVYTGQHSVFRGRTHGSSTAGVPAERFVVCTQNHDQVGNRMAGERLSSLLDFEGLKLAAGVLLLSPFLPMLFMGQEWGEQARFLYFVSHSDPELIAAVRDGRKRELSESAWKGDVPDPQAPETLHRSRINHSLQTAESNRALLDLYKQLIRIRKSRPAILQQELNPSLTLVHGENTLIARRNDRHGEMLLIFHFGTASSDAGFPAPAGRWNRIVDSSDPRWLGADGEKPAVTDSDGRIEIRLPPRSFCVLARPLSQPA